MKDLINKAHNIVMSEKGMDRKYGTKNSDYRAGTPLAVPKPVPTVPLGRGLSMPQGEELPAMILPGEAGYEEDEIL